MDKQSQSQLELFSQTGEISGVNSETRKPFWTFIWSYEKAIFTIMGFIIVGIIAFTLGVEKGKRITVINPTLQANPESVRQITITKQITPNQQAVNATTTLKQPAPVAIAKESAPLPSEIAGQYTIQIASFKTRNIAQKEFELLKNKGFSPFLLTKKGIMVLYVGNFTNKTQAKSLLSQLQKRYKDCFIRRL